MHKLNPDLCRLYTIAKTPYDTIRSVSIIIAIIKQQLVVIFKYLITLAHLISPFHS